MSDKNIIFCGLSKNSGLVLKKNLNFLVNFINFSELNIKVFLVDTDSEREIKQFLINLNKNNSSFNVFNEDNLDSKINSRLKRITMCRNLCLKYIYDNLNFKNVIYIPFDTDLDLFENTSMKKLEEKIIKVINEKNIQALFPISTPRYYDILALRAEGWVKYNSQLLNHKLKKFFKLGSFVFNYLFVFRHQWNVQKIKSKEIKILSAFGGIAIYDLSKNKNKIFYETSQKDTEFVSEHVKFNSYFENKVLDTNWIVEAPKEHTEFHTLNIKNKFIYFFKTIKNDVLNIWN